jgi:hypothetical protein
MVKNSTSLADDIVNQYVKHCQLAGHNVVEYDDIDEIEIYELAAIFMQEDKRDAYCCLSDNDHLDSDIIPAIMAVLHRPGNQEAGWNLRETIQKSVAQYYRRRTEELLEERLAVWETEHHVRHLKSFWNPATDSMYEAIA